MNSSEKFAIRLEMLLKSKGMTQKALAETLHVSQSLITSWKNGASIKPEYLAAMAEIFDVTMDYLWLGKETDNNTVDDGTESDSLEAPVNHVISTEAAVEVAFDRVAENRKLSIMIQTFGTVVALILILYLGLSGAYEAFNQYPSWSYSLFCSTLLGVTFGLNAISATPFPRFRKFMLILAVMLACITIALVLGLCIWSR
ncbi:MAG: helix-turn-helix transcriptional regulator [Oribacterium sp.]|nr:helix-turn-helix transcriptional regulator [Oribacterium sp.]